MDPAATLLAIFAFGVVISGIVLAGLMRASEHARRVRRTEDETAEPAPNSSLDEPSRTSTPETSH